MVASFPHFYLADDKYVAAIDGMSPHRTHHQTFLDLNPVSHSTQFNSLKSTIYSAAMISNVNAVTCFSWSLCTFNSIVEIYSSKAIYECLKRKHHSTLRCSTMPLSGEEVLVQQFITSIGIFSAKSTVRITVLLAQKQVTKYTYVQF